MRRCKANTKSGDQCRNNAIPGTRFCYLSSHGGGQEPFVRRAANFIGNKWLGFFLGVLGIALTGLGLRWYIYDKQINATSGVISAATQRTPMSISIGSAEFVMFSHDGMLFRDNEGPLLSVRLTNGRLLVTTQIRDASGALLAEMKDNEWKHLPQPAIFDRNYTMDVLEIRDKSGKVALQVANLGSTVDVAAIFHCANGWTYSVGPIAGAGSAIELSPPGSELQSEIPAICDYPSDLHFGSCPGIERLRHMMSGIHSIHPMYAPVALCVNPAR
jgi:hypothetical protein